MPLFPLLPNPVSSDGIVAIFGRDGAANQRREPCSSAQPGEREVSEEPKVLTKVVLGAKVKPLSEFWLYPVE